MARLSLKAIEERVKPLAGREVYDRDFFFDLLLAYGRSKGNVTRLQFCYFAEDTGIFTENQFTNAVGSQNQFTKAVGSHTLDDGSDTAEFIRELFAALDEADPAKSLRICGVFPTSTAVFFIPTPR
ncbi:type IIL restriction-modification enzyme MmeI [Corynebacterium auriscanis]